jgi:hypothetical protein
MIALSMAECIGNSDELKNILYSNLDLREILLDIDNSKEKAPEILAKYLSFSGDFNRFSDLVLKIVNLRNKDNEFVG